MSAVAARPAQPVLPELRQELRLHAGPKDGASGSWLIYDPVRHRYFQVTPSTFQLIERWRPEAFDTFAKRVELDLGRPVSIAEISELAEFVITNHLSVVPARGDARSLADREAATHQSPLHRAIHSYLFFKIPIVRPERFLRETMPYVAPLYSRTAAVIIAVITLIGLYLVSRQWDTFASTFLDFFSPEGALVYAASLLVLKALHELGHAYTATRLGIRVNTMGIAFMVLTPILYTDVTDAWRLRRRRDRLAIDIAGITVEMAIAGISIFLWSFLPEGPMRSVMFVTATSSLAMGLLININPLMRFDGYHLMADAIQVPNLQDRSNALARWWLRETLFKLDHPVPESFPAKKRNFLIGYAFAVWVYRFFLFIGIALLVYHLFFKALGILLFAIEIIWFVVYPIAHELTQWWKMRGDILRSKRSRITAWALAAMVLIFIIPWKSTIAIQGVALSGLQTAIYSPRPARIVQVDAADGETVIRGQPLIRLDSPELDHEIDQTGKKIALTRYRLERIAADTADRLDRNVLESQLSQFKTTLAGLEDEKKKLIVVAPHDGVVRDFDRDLQAGDWIDEVTPIARVVNSDETDARGYLKEDDIWRIAPGNAATFVPEYILDSQRKGYVMEIEQTRTRNIDLPYLASVYGGAIPSDREPDGELRPQSGRNLVRIKLDGVPVDQVARGTILISGKSESFASSVWRRILQVLVRESTV